MKLSWHIIVSATAVALTALNAFTNTVPQKYSALMFFSVSVLQALHALAAKYDTPPGGGGSPPVK